MNNISILIENGELIVTVSETYHGGVAGGGGGGLGGGRGGGGAGGSSHRFNLSQHIRQIVREELRNAARPDHKGDDAPYPSPSGDGSTS